jgi:DNA-binding response OmpR family regulator
MPVPNQYRGSSPAGPSFPETAVYSVLRSSEAVQILYLCEEVQIAEQEVLPILRDAGFDVQIAQADPSQAADLLDQGCGLVLLDIGDHAAEGYRVCARIRSISLLPIMLILRGAACQDVLPGFDAGADTFVRAPLSTREFLARLGALIRRVPCKQVRPL